MKAIDAIEEMYLTEEDLAKLLNVDSKRIRDLRSHHITGKAKFIDHIKPSGKQRLYHIENVIQFLKDCPVYFFGSNKNEEPELESGTFSQKIK